MVNLYFIRSVGEALIPDLCVHEMKSVGLELSFLNCVTEASEIKFSS